MKQLAAIVTLNLRITFPFSGPVVFRHDALPVIDQTGLVGNYDITVDLRQNGDWFEVLEEQLGLKLEARKVPVSVLVIDGATQPLPN